MSTSEGNHDGSHADSQGDAHAHAPPALPEPHTPMWLPAVGALLFLTVGLLWALSTPSKELPDLSAMPAGSATPTTAATTTATAPNGAPGGHAAPARPQHP